MLFSKIFSLLKSLLDYFRCYGTVSVWYSGTLEIQFNEIDIEVVSNTENMKTSRDQEISRSMLCSFCEGARTIHRLYVSHCNMRKYRNRILTF